MGRAGQVPLEHELICRHFLASPQTRQCDIASIILTTKNGGRLRRSDPLLASDERISRSILVAAQTHGSAELSAHGVARHVDCGEWARTLYLAVNSFKLPGQDSHNHVVVPDPADICSLALTSLLDEAAL